ncbi:ShKT domain-containing protein [Caenorhabditis elegans]|uniref:ShKT domain-containing protein n=1 Tax=Caenorhabditis elegans TaxID=6239 RepID=Q6BES2_CAEEL|nr:ShKT domain-containing protein [Caenorhabditis elegans]CAH04750.1 ShKT domain-containing protein [Caenorhabditis elegans]|eukprot:NP_001024812.1 Uncharacterized protein CELE_M163.8 [Caenorhabditis elegans]
MSSTSLCVLAVLIIFSTVEMCMDVNPNCANWVSNGFCTSSFYSDAQKTEYCPASCRLCSGASSTTSSSASSSSSTCGDSNSNCASWASNGFCNSTFYTPAQKSQYCGATCNLCGGASVETSSGVAASTTAATATTSA